MTSHLDYISWTCMTENISFVNYSTHTTYYCNIYTSLNQLLCLESSTSTSTFKLLEDSLEEKLEKNGVSNADSEKADGELREGEGEENKKKSVDWGKQATTIKKLKKDKAGSATTKASRSESTAVSGAPYVKPELALPVIPPEVEHSLFDDLRNRVQLSGGASLSISFYTFINTHDGLNCASISSDGSLVAGGFSDSSLKVWNMGKLGQQNEYSLCRVKMSWLPMGRYIAITLGKDHIRYFEDIVDPFIRPRLVHLEIFFYRRHQIQQCVRWHAN